MSPITRFLVGWTALVVAAVVALIAQSAIMLRRAWRHGYSPLACIAPRADSVLVAVLRRRFGHRD